MVCGMRYKFKLATCVQGPLVIDRRGGVGWYGAKFKQDNGWQPITDAGSRGRGAVTNKCYVSE